MVEAVVVADLLLAVKARLAVKITHTTRMAKLEDIMKVTRIWSTKQFWHYAFLLIVISENTEIFRISPCGILLLGKII